MHDHLPDETHLHDGWCQCRCNDCYARVAGACVCPDCRCGLDDEDEHVAEHNWLVTVTEMVEDFGLLALDIEHHRVAMAECGARRRDVVMKMRQMGLGYGKIAELCGVSKGRIQQQAKAQTRTSARENEPPLDNAGGL